MKRSLVFLAFMGWVLFAGAQRRYAPSSVLATGKWIKIAVDSPGVYRVTGDFLQKAGFPKGLPSQNLRLFGNGGGVLPESNQMVPVDDLRENAIEVSDGGDGIFDAGDHFIFYASGPDQWTYDTLNRQFRFQKNPYAASAFYFITASDSGLRIADAPALTGPAPLVDTYDERYHHELDSINFLKSGKEWFGEDFAAQNGRLSFREFSLGIPDAVNGSRFNLVSEVAGRSFGKPNTVEVQVNGQQVVQHSTSPLVGTLLEPYASPSRVTGSGTLNSNTLRVGYRFTAGSVNAEAWLNWFEVFFRRSLQWQGSSPLFFRDLASLGTGGRSQFRIKGATPQVAVWDVTESQRPVRMRTTVTGTDLQFVADGSALREYVAFGSSYRIPKLVGDVANQNLHAISAQDMVMVADRSLLPQAERLAAFHRQRGLKVAVVDVDQVFNEFASGAADPTAIRNFMKMLYDRATAGTPPAPGYLLLFGGASYVYKEKADKKQNLVPSYQSASSLDPLTTYVSDDYFGYLDDQDDINLNLPAPLLDLAIGRIPARTLEQARIAVDKILGYHQPTALGPWRNHITLLADDEDFNIHLQDAEFHAATIEERAPAWQMEKLYLDAFEQLGGSGGSRYPEVNDLIKRGLEKGTLVWNYSGHGSSTRLAQESILEKSHLPLFNNPTRLPLFITATCDFAPFDDPSLFSIGEELLVGRSTGAIGLLTTTRLVFAASNKVINNNYFRFLFQKSNTGLYPTLGRSLMDAKNFTVVNSGDFNNARKFILLGDPAVKLTMPEHVVHTLAVNGKPVGTDTLKALNAYTIEGEVRRPGGGLAADFTGFLYTRIHDKPVTVKTRANDPQSSAVAFNNWKSLIYDGKVKVEQGKFSFSFVVPRDIDLRYGLAKISYYADNGTYDANGHEGSIMIGGFGNKASNDGQGPVIKAYLNDENFVNGGRVGETPLLLVKLSDLSGINTTGTGIGHDITAVIDGNVKETLVLNDYYAPDAGAAQQGTIRFLLPALSEGPHRIVIKAWDVFNNSSEVAIECIVVLQKEILIQRFVNFPNPFYGNTTFAVEMDGPLNGSLIQLDILDLLGRVISTFSKAINDAAQRSYFLEWDGKNDQGVPASRGVYVARLVVRTKEGKESRKLRKLIIH